MHASNALPPRPDHARRSAYVLIALAALLAGFFLGLACRQGPGTSRADWPPASAHPPRP